MGARGWLGERGQPTQIDAFISLRRGGRERGFILVEVKLTEAGFGGCRGAKRAGPNPTPERCGNLDAVRADPQTQCWLAEKEGRLYWKLLSGSGSTMALAELPSDAPCPFGGGLYQLMRSRVLADALVAETGAAWADVAVCVHPSNDQIARLETAVARHRNVMDAFLALAPTAPLLAIDSLAVVSAICGAAPMWADWADYMKDRYALA